MVRQNVIRNESEGMEGIYLFNPSHEKFTKGLITKEGVSIFGDDGEEICATFNIFANVFPHEKEFIITSDVGRVPLLNPAFFLVGLTAGLENAIRPTKRNGQYNVRLDNN